MASYGAQSMTDPMTRVLVKRPGAAFGAAFDEPKHGFLHRVDLELARRQHDQLLELLAGLGVHIDELGRENGEDPDIAGIVPGPQPLPWDEGDIE